MKNVKPAWWVLYAMLPVGAALLVAVDVVSPSAGWRIFMECLVTLAILGAIAIWLRVNRAALALRESPPQTEQTVRAWVAYCPPATTRRNHGLLETTPNQHQVLRTDRPVEEGVTCFVK